MEEMARMWAGSRLVKINSESQMVGRCSVEQFCSMAAWDVTRVGGGNPAHHGGTRELREMAMKAVQDWG